MKWNVTDLRSPVMKTVVPIVPASPPWPDRVGQTALDLRREMVTQFESLRASIRELEAKVEQISSGAEVERLRKRNRRLLDELREANHTISNLRKKLGMDD